MTVSKRMRLQATMARCVPRTRPFVYLEFSRHARLELVIAARHH
jgi:hypothetical protein